MSHKTQFNKELINLFNIRTSWLSKELFERKPKSALSAIGVSSYLKMTIKQTIYILAIALGFLACKNELKQVDETTFAIKDSTISKADDTTIVISGSAISQVDNSKYYTQEDTIFIPTEIGDTLEFAKSDFNRIVDEHPELFQEFQENPDKLYYRFVNGVDFGSEQGQDVYYALYAYFLKQENGITKYTLQRKKLIELYSNINSLFRHFQYGGTYFGHQQMRILGYAEYSIYLYPKEKDEIEKTYDITKQKELYIKSLRQLIEDESKIDYETLGKEKIIRNQKLNLIVDKIERLITDIFFLRRAQEFHYSNYEYY